MKSYLVIVGALLLSCCNIIAQDEGLDTLQLLDTLQIQDIVVTAQFAPRSERNAIYKIETISSETIENKAANNLRELLQQEGLLSLTQNSIFGSSVAMQGISKENIKILIDGTPVIGRLNGIVDLNQINLSNIERVEIIKGPVSVFYGTDASGGIINLITKKSQRKKITGSFSGYYETIGAMNFDGDIGFQFGKNLIRLNGGYYNFDGLNTDNTAVRNLNWEKRTQYFASLMYARTFGDLRLMYNGRISKEMLHAKEDPDRRGDVVDKKYHTRRIDNTLSLSGRVFKKNFLDVTASYLNYERYHDTYDFDSTGLVSVLSETDTKEDNVVRFNYAGLKGQFGKSVAADALNYGGGISVFYEDNSGDRILDDKQMIVTAAAYASINYNLFKIVELQPALRYTWNSKFGSVFSPAFNSLIRLGKKHKIRISYGHGFRAPTLKELYLDFRINMGPMTFVISGNDKLEVEKSHSVNFSYDFRTLLGDGSKSLAVEFSAFYNDISNLITLSEIENNSRHYINIDKFRSVGGALDLGFRPIESLLLRTKVTLLGRYNKFSEDYDTKEFLFSPEVIANISYTFEKAQMTFNAFFKYSGEREGFVIDPVSTELSKIKIKSFSNLGLTVSKSFFKRKLVLSAGVKNLFNVTDVEAINEIGQSHSRDLQLWGRSFFLKAKINL